MHRLIYILLYLQFPLIALGQSSIIKGKITDKKTGSAIANANIINIYTKAGMSTDSTGAFSIQVSPTELIEISHVSYNTARVRVQKGQMANFYSIELEAKTTRIKEIIIKDQTNNFTLDSIETAERYHVVLNQPSFEDYDLKAGLISMLSKQQRQKWAFLEMHEKWEKEKYIDYRFNENKIARWTKMSGAQLERFMQIYRPSYEYARSANEYQFMKYIKDCVAVYCPQCPFKVR